MLSNSFLKVDIFFFERGINSFRMGGVGFYMELLNGDDPDK